MNQQPRNPDDLERELRRISSEISRKIHSILQGQIPEFLPSIDNNGQTSDRALDLNGNHFRTDLLLSFKPDTAVESIKSVADNFTNSKFVTKLLSQRLAVAHVLSNLFSGWSSQDLKSLFHEEKRTILIDNLLQYIEMQISGEIPNGFNSYSAFESAVRDFFAVNMKYMHMFMYFINSLDDGDIRIPLIISTSTKQVGKDELDRMHQLSDDHRKYNPNISGEAYIKESDGLIASIYIAPDNLVSRKDKKEVVALNRVDAEQEQLTSILNNVVVYWGSLMSKRSSAVHGQLKYTIFHEGSSLIIKNPGEGKFTELPKYAFKILMSGDPKAYIFRLKNDIEFLTKLLTDVCGISIVEGYGIDNMSIQFTVELVKKLIFLIGNTFDQTPQLERSEIDKALADLNDGILSLSERFK